MFKRVVLVLVVLLAAIVEVRSYYDGVCNSLGMAGAEVTVAGVYCWRRINDTYDNYEPLEKLQADAERRESAKACRDINAGKEYLCDPRFKRPIKEKNT